MKKEKSYRICLYCNGKGRILSKRKPIDNKKREQARIMYKAGIGLRTIGKTLRIGHPQKVKSMILAKTK